MICKHYSKLFHAETICGESHFRDETLGDVETQEVCWKFSILWKFGKKIQKILQIECNDVLNVGNALL